MQINNSSDKLCRQIIYHLNYISMCIDILIKYEEIMILLQFNYNNYGSEYVV